MTRDEVMLALTEIFRERFDDDGIVLTDATTAKDIPDWDSLEHIMIINAIEKRFRLKLSMREASGFANVGDMADTIVKKLG